MAEAAGVALAVPGVIDIIIRGGVAVYEKVDTFRNIDETTRRFRDIALDIREGTLFFALTALKTASDDRLVPKAIQAQLQRVLDRADAALTAAKQGLSHVKDDTTVGMLIYTLWKGNGSKSRLDKLFEQLKSACDELTNLCLQLYQYRTSRSSFLLMPDFFKLRHETTNNRPGSLLPDSDIFIAHGNYTIQGQRVTCDFVLETKARENDVQFLSTKLNSESLKDINDGLLPVLGYRQPPYNQPDGTKIFQLVIQLQPGLERSSLSHWICTEPALSLLERLRLCSKLACAIQTVHSIGLVHKSLHPRSVLILSEAGMPKSSGTAYLQDWTFIRELSGATTQIGEDLWPKRIYQHPERQGKYADAAYEPKHDIYSLGVCMLEVLLWKPFVVTDPTSNGQTLRICQLFESYGLARGEQDGGLPLRYQGDSAKLAGRPRATKTIWEDIAARELKDQDLTQLVLECLGSSFQTAEDVVRQLKVLIEARTP